MMESEIGSLIWASLSSSVLTVSDDVKALARAGRAGDDVDAARSQPQRFEHIEADLDLFHRVGGQAHADRVANPRPEEIAHADRGFDRADARAARLCNAEMQRRVCDFRELVIGGDGQENIRGFDRNFIIVEAFVIEHAGVHERALDHRVGARLAIFFQQFAFQRAAIDADTNGAAIGARGGDDFFDPVIARQYCRD